MNVAQMRDRDNDACYRCGTSRGLTTQHRINRQAGGVHGEAAVLADRPSNRISLCWTCNWELEADAEAANDARIHGWKLLHSEDPTEVAVWHQEHAEWRLLDDEGGYRIVASRDPEMTTWEVAK